MKPPAPCRTIVWAVDPSVSNGLLLGSAKAIHPFASREITVIPVCVENRVPLPEAGVLPAEVVERNRRAARSSIESAGKRARLPRVAEAEFVSGMFTGRKEEVSALLELARARDAELIVAGTHARKGLARLFVGSFAETLMRASEIPVLIVNPRFVPRSRTSRTRGRSVRSATRSSRPRRNKARA
jgi:nucleotide-binding universal stress UspA family protein